MSTTPVVPPVAPAPTTAQTNLQAAVQRTGDIDWDELFGVDPDSAPAQPAAPATTAPQTQPVETPAPEVFLQTPTGTVYKTQEEAIRGFSHKDEVIESLRKKFIETTGTDPITGKAVTNQPQTTAPVGPTDYFSKPETLWDKLEAAVKSGDKRGYAQTLQEFVGATLAPYAPALNEVVQQHSVDKVNSSISGFKEWRYSPQFSESVGKFPLLKQAIEASESNPALSGQLPELYQLAYWTSQGQRTPEVNAAVAAAQTAAPPAAPVQTRPTTSPTMQPPLQAPSIPDLRTAEGRQAIIKNAEARGVADARIFEDVFRRY